ncbi:MAG: type II secretion system major pseudopilin GspG [Hyphomicrobium sp.]
MQILRDKFGPYRRQSEAGFTLIEILVVLAIIGLIVSVVGPRVIGYLSDSKVKAARIQVDSLSAALDLFYLDAGRYPSNTENLAGLVQRPVGLNSWNGPYLKGVVVPKDPWGNAYVYRFPGQHGAYDLYSLGPEGREGANNIANWSK